MARTLTTEYDGPAGTGTRPVSRLASPVRPITWIVGTLLVVLASAMPAAGQIDGALPTPVLSPTSAPAPATPGAGMPSIGELMTVIEKATAPAPGSTSGPTPQSTEWATPVKLVIIFGALAVLPSLLVMMTSFTRIVIVLSFVRRALTTQTIPPTVAVIGLAMFLTLYTMAPTYARVNKEAIQPYLTDQASLGTATATACQCLKDFMLRQSRKSDVALFVEMSKSPVPATPADIPLHVVVPAFIISEFRTAFEIGCLLFIPFLLIDMVIASVLLSAGMMMLPPVMISLPFKLILFILVDGWGLLARSLSLGFR